MSYLLLLLLILQPAPPPALSATWQGGALVVSWQAPGFHTVWLDNQPVDSAVNQATFQLRAGGVSAAYAPHPGQVLRLIDVQGREVGWLTVPARVYRVILPLIVRIIATPPVLYARTGGVAIIPHVQ